MDQKQETAVTAVVEQFRAIATEYKENSEEISRLQLRQGELELKAQDCYAAARLFGFNLAVEAAVADTTRLPKKGNVPLAPPLHTKTIREMVMEEVKNAYPQPVRATPLRNKLEEVRKERLHDKTIGMTLYRLLKENFVKRVGKDWFYNPQPTLDEMIE